MKTWSVFVIPIAALLLAACGGGSSGSANTNTPPPIGEGISGDGIAAGTIDRFSSVVVNGVTFDTSNALIIVDGQQATQADLKIGQFVIVTGQFDDNGNTGTADSVVFDENVEGPITVGSIDMAAGSFVVLGQTVFVDASTLFDDNISPASLAGLSGGDFVEVSGFFDSDGNILATRIEKENAGGDLEVTGLVSDLDPGTSTFMISQLLVDFSSATLDDFASGMISDGDLVEAECDPMIAPGGQCIGALNELLATKVEFKGDAIDDDDGLEAEVEGLITRFASAMDFDVAGIPVITNGSTAFENGSAADLGLNVKVEVEGSFNASGVLVADKVDIRRATTLRIGAAIQSIDIGGSSFDALGVTVRVDELTSFEDKSDGVENFDLGDLNAGDFVEVRGGGDPNDATRLLASRIERDNDDGPAVEIRGPVDALMQPELTIFGVDVTTDGSTDFELNDESPITADQFFQQASQGDIVEANGMQTGTSSLLADEVEFEDD